MSLFEKQSEATTIEELKAEWDTCTQCPFHADRRQVVLGSGDPSQARIAAVGQAPGRDEDREGIPFVGSGGRVTKQQFLMHNIPEEKVWWTNVLACAPSSHLKGAVRKAWAEHCWDRLDAELRIVSPRYIIALGRPAAARFIPNLPPKGDVRGLPFTYKGIPGRTMLHPAVINRMKKNKKLYEKALQDVSDDLQAIYQEITNLGVLAD